MSYLSNDYKKNLALLLFTTMKFCLLTFVVCDFSVSLDSMSFNMAALDPFLHCLGHMHLSPHITLERMLSALSKTTQGRIKGGGLGVWAPP